jgi:hypothetical protein
MLIDELISAELAKQNDRFGDVSIRTDVASGELMWAGMAQLDAEFDRQNGEPDPFAEAPEIYPANWRGFRDYGSTVANIVVAIAFLTQEGKRLLLNGADYTRTERTADQPLPAAMPALVA